MPYRDLINQRKKDFEAAFDFTKSEIASIRTGRAHSSMVEDLRVDYMGSKLKVKELAGISVPESRVLYIQPWDKNAIAPIEKSIRESSLGLNPATDSNGLRLTIPALTEDRRKEFIKLLGQKIEEARIKIRQIREDILKKIQTEVREKKVREDDLRNAKDELQKIIDEYNNKFEDIYKKKEQELLI